MKKILLSILTIGLVVSVAVGATRAVFFDTETSYDNTFTAGTLDLKVDGEDDGDTVLSYSLSDMKPSDTAGYYVWCLKNVGSIDGQPSVEFSVITNDDNDCNEPELDVPDSGCGAGEGELGQYLKPTIGYAPCGWSVPSILYSNWQAGPPHPWGTPGLNELSGMTVGDGTKFTFPVLGQDEEIGFFLKLALTGPTTDDDLEYWDGTKWLDINDNIVQSDGVEFDLIFHLDQATP